jgi:hypothetical protein
MTETTVEEQKDDMTAEEQIESWKEELELAMAGQQWRRALQLCSWLRYALGQRGVSDPGVEEIHRQAKAGLAEQVEREKRRKREREKLRRRRAGIMEQIDSGRSKQALDSIEGLVQDGASRHEVVQLLEKLRMRMGRVLDPRYRQTNRRAAMLGHRLEELEERAMGEEGEGPRGGGD